jgi:hypothetical protein
MKSRSNPYREKIMSRLPVTLTAMVLFLAGCTSTSMTPVDNANTANDADSSDDMSSVIDDTPDADSSDEPTTIFGSVDYRTKPASDYDTTGRTCISAHLIIPKVEGATYYAIHAYGFNDPLFFGTEIFESLDPLNPRDHDAGGQATPQIDEGDQWSQGLSGECGPDPSMEMLQSRFEGMIVEVELTFAQ